MKNRIKDILSSKKMIYMVTICTVFFCALIVTIFLTNQKQDMNGKETEIAKETAEKVTTSSTKAAASSTKETVSSSKKKEVGPWTDYDAFIEDVKEGIEDDFSSVSAENLSISPIFEEEIPECYSMGYYFVDLDSDGMDELMFGYRDRRIGWGAICDIYTMKDGSVFHVASRTDRGDWEENCLYLCENGNIECVNYSPNTYLDGYIKDGYTAYYAFQDGGLQLVEALVEEFVGSQDTKWFYSTKGTTSENAEEISWEEVREIKNQDGYSHQDIQLTLFEELPVTKDYEDNEDLTYADLTGKEFWFYSGAGAWATILTIHADGTFTGYYEDADAGDIGDGYIGSSQICDFSGRFSALTKTGPYEYTMKCLSLKLEQEPGTEEIIDGRLIRYSEPYGFDDAEEFKVYLPGKKWSELPWGFLSWSHGEAASGYLECYGIYNVGGKDGLVEMD